MFAHASLWLAVFLPSLLFVIGASSMAAGSLVAALVVIVMHARATADHLARSPRRTLGFVLGIGAVVLHLCLAGIQAPVSWGKALGSIGLLGLVFVAAQALAIAVMHRPRPHLEGIVGTIVVAMVAVLVIGLSGLVPPDAFGRNKLIFPFSEPSHFALAFTPLALFAAVRLRGAARLGFVLGTFALGLAAQNLTMMASAGLVLLASGRLGIVPLALAAMAAVVAVADVSYFSARLLLSDDSDNLSALVYLQGWQMMAEALARTDGLGLGFQQLGERTLDVAASAIIYQLGGLDLNLNDGGFVMAKLVCEFGVLGIAVAGVLGGLGARSLLTLRREAATPGRLAPGRMLAHCLIAGYLLDLLVRGTGYFSGTSLLLVAALLRLADEMSPHSAAPARDAAPTTLTLRADG